MDAMGMGVLGVRATRVQAESSRPWAPEVEESAHERRIAHRATRRAERERQRAGRPVAVAAPRRAAAGALHRLADALAPAEPRASQRAGHPVH